MCVCAHGKMNPLAGGGWQQPTRASCIMNAAVLVVFEVLSVQSYLLELSPRRDDPSPARCAQSHGTVVARCLLASFLWGKFRLRRQ